MISTESRAYEGIVEIPDNQGLAFSPSWGLGDYHIQVGIKNFGGFYIADIAKLDKDQKPTPVRWNFNDMTGRLDEIDMWDIGWTPDLIRRKEYGKEISPSIQYTRVTRVNITEHLRNTQDYLRTGFLAAKKLLEILHQPGTKTGNFRDIPDLTPKQRDNHPLTFMGAGEITHPISKLRLDEELIQSLKKAAQHVHCPITPREWIIDYSRRA